MQAFSVSPDTRVYSADMAMGRPAKSKRTEFGERLLTARLHLGLTQAQVADKVGITQQSYAAWERYDTALKPQHLVLLADALQVSVEHLLGAKEPPKRGSGPTGRMRRLFEAASKLPRSQQQKVAELVELFVERHSDKAA
jgi:transcriptional regulator with XRE-family HTH domain